MIPYYVPKYSYSNTLGDVRGNQGIVIFGAEEMIQRACIDGNLCTDGMFGETPKVVTQLCTIHAMINRMWYPIIYAFLPNKMEATYRSLLKEIKNIQVHCKIDSFKAFYWRQCYQLSL